MGQKSGRLSSLIDSDHRAGGAGRWPVFVPLRGEYRDSL